MSGLTHNLLIRILRIRWAPLIELIVWTLANASISLSV
jgi:hypothetical protein